MDRDAVRRCLGRCDEALHSAETLAGEGLYPEAISRCWYAAAHAAILVISHVDREIRSPAEAERLFTAEFAAAHRLPGELVARYESIRRARSAAERNDLIRYSQEETGRVIAETHAYLALIRGLVPATT